MSSSVRALCGPTRAGANPCARPCAAARAIILRGSITSITSSAPLLRRPPDQTAVVAARGLRSALAASLSPPDRDDDRDAPSPGPSSSSSSSSSPPGTIVVTGFAPDECLYCRESLGLPVVAATAAMLSAPLERQGELAAAELEAALARDAAAHGERGEEEEDAGDDDDAASSSSSFFSSSSTLANNGGGGGAASKQQQQRRQPPASPPAIAADTLALGRVALFVGDPAFAAAYASSLNDELVSGELWPAIVAAPPRKHAARPLRDALLAIRDAHARQHRLVQPLCVDPALAAIPPGATLAMNLEIDASDAVPIAATAAAAAAAAAAGAGAAAPLTRRDASHVVVLDGLLSDDERAELLAALTSPNHDPSSPPPGDKWKRDLVDRSGEPPTWGLRPSVIRELLRDPPRALVALQSRLAALYPEYLLCAMPAAAMRGGGDQDSEEEEEDGEGADFFIASIVGNAVASGDPVAWHVDADPSLLPADAPFATHWGPYFNREPRKPLLVSVFFYLNAVWEDDWHAETLFLDPATGVGAFSSAKPGRIVLLDQDITHRIGAPSAVRAPGLRYSLVLKTIWLPKEGEHSAGLARAEWGPPQQLGSAARAIGPRGKEVRAGGEA